MKFGVDIGGITIDRVNNTTDTSFSGDRYLETHAVPGVFDALHVLNHRKFKGEIYFIPKCGEVVEEKTVHWLEYNQVFRRTCIDPSHIFFCRERKDKAVICKELGITHFVDDRLEVLGYLKGIVPYRFLLNSQSEEVQEHKQHLVDVTKVDSWLELKEQLLAKSAKNPL